MSHPVTLTLTTWEATSCRRTLAARANSTLAVQGQDLIDAGKTSRCVYENLLRKDASILLPRTRQVIAYCRICKNLKSKVCQAAAITSYEASMAVQDLR